jgi:hypothetical protein
METYGGVDLSIYLFMVLKSFVGPWPLFSFLIFLRGRYDSLYGGSARGQATTYTHRTTQTQNKRTRTFIPQVGFELTIPMFE